VGGAANAGLASEKKSIHAAERDTEANRQQRAAYLERIGQIDPERLIYLDESGVSTQMTRRSGRVHGSARLREAIPAGGWKTLTVLGALSTKGIVAAMTVEAATDREVFLTYLDEVLCPKLKPGDVVVMDNLSTHHVEEVRQRIEAAQAELIYLPPYSPDLNPIEKAWSKLKQLMGASKARSVQALDDAIEALLPQITAENAQAWFRLRFGKPQ
jgi:transposase